jgi:hypothetical protein
MYKLEGIMSVTVMMLVFKRIVNYFKKTHTVMMKYARIYFQNWRIVLLSIFVIVLCVKQARFETKFGAVLSRNLH